MREIRSMATRHNRVRVWQHKQPWAECRVAPYCGSKAGGTAILTGTLAIDRRSCKSTDRWMCRLSPPGKLNTVDLRECNERMENTVMNRTNAIGLVWTILPILCGVLAWQVKANWVGTVVGVSIFLTALTQQYWSQLFRADDTVVA